MSVPATDTLDRRFALGRKIQVAFLVNDLDTALDLWTRKLGVAPFVVFEHSLGDRHYIYRGERSHADIAIALSYIGETQIELVFQHNDAPTIYSNAKSPRADGALAHHLAFWPDDMDAAYRDLVSKGFEEVASIRTPTGEVDVYYFSSPASLGLMLEIVPMSSARRVYFGKIKELCQQPKIDRSVMRFRDKNEFLASLQGQ